MLTNRRIVFAVFKRKSRFSFQVIVGLLGSAMP